MAQKYTVQADHTLFKLAERFYGDGKRYLGQMAIFSPRIYK